MSGIEPELDDVDRGILHLLQQDARNNTTREIGEAVGVSAGTVRNRIEKLEETGVIRGYVPDVDYERAGYQLVILFTCTAVEPSETLAQDILDEHGVITFESCSRGRKTITSRSSAPTPTTSRRSPTRSGSAVSRSCVPR